MREGSGPFPTSSGEDFDRFSGVTRHLSAAVDVLETEEEDLGVAEMGLQVVE